jgi:hypothetical protein
MRVCFKNLWSVFRPLGPFAEPTQSLGRQISIVWEQSISVCSFGQADSTRFYKQVAARRGEKVAIVAAARQLMRAIYIMLKGDERLRLDG